MAVNNFEHERTAGYDLWRPLVGRVFKNDPHELLCARRLCTIDAACQDLVEECERQPEDWVRRRQEGRQQAECPNLEAGLGSTRHATEFRGTYPLGFSLFAVDSQAE